LINLRSVLFGDVDINFKISAWFDVEPFCGNTFWALLDDQVREFDKIVSKLLRNIFVSVDLRVRLVELREDLFT